MVVEKRMGRSKHGMAMTDGCVAYGVFFCLLCCTVQYGVLHPHLGIYFLSLWLARSRKGTLLFDVWCVARACLSITWGWRWLRFLASIVYFYVSSWR